MRKSLAAGVIALCLMAPTSAVAFAGDAASTPTTLVVKTTTVEVPATTIESKELETKDDDDSDKTGLWGLLGLLGLAGLAGLRKPKRDAYTTGTVRGDTTPRGSTSSGH